MDPSDATRVRDALDIFWSSLGTVIACTYTVLHLNVPRQRQGRDPGWRGDVKWKLKDPTWRWFLLTIIIPEVYLSFSFFARWEATRHLRELHRRKPETKDTWELRHMVFATMGGFALEVRPKEAGEQAVDTRRERAGLAKPEIYHLTPQQVIYLISEDLISGMVSIEEINDRAKTSSVSKFLSIVQVTYFLIAFFLRWAQGLTLTPLEVGVVAYVVVAIVNYLFVWSRPQGVTTVIPLASCSEDESDSILEKLKAKFQDQKHNSLMKPGKPIHNGHVERQISYMFFIFGSSILLGGICLAGWNLHFPTAVDTWLWRGAALFTTSASVISILVETVLAPCFGDFVDSLFMTVMVLLYISGRVILLVEMVRSLFYLPPGAFISTWADDLPHIG